MLALVAALAACTGALADNKPAPAPEAVISSGGTYKAMPCLGAARGIGHGGLMMSAVTVKNAAAKGYKAVNVSVRAGVLFTYVPDAATSASFIGVQLVNQSVTVPVGTTTIDFPVSVPLLGTDGSLSAVETTATLTLTQTSKTAYSGDFVLGEFVCGANVIRPAVTPLNAGVTAALTGLINSASGAGAAGAIATAIAQ